MKEATPQAVEEMLAAHRQFFHTGATQEAEFRLRQLGKLKAAIQKYEERIIAALHHDLRKSEFEAYATEIGFTLDSIGYMMKHLKRWMKPVKVRTPLHIFPGQSRILSEPYGTVLIIGPFNYPFQLLIEPLIGAIAAGNCAVLKPSESTPAVAEVIQALIEETFEPAYIRVVQGEKETTGALIHAKFDYIFFTGSVPVGKIVMEAAAKNLVPVTLELGGKSPVIVDKTANLEIAAKRIVWGKLMNAGQTCIAPDYLLVQEEVADRLIGLIKESVAAFYGQDARLSPDYGRIVNERQLQRIAGLITQDQRKLIHGGTVVPDDLFVEPALLHPAEWSDAAMQEEIFGPVLPIMEYRSLEDAIRMINDRPKPLALYLFTEDKQVSKEVLRRVSFGGGCVNDTITHVSSAHLPFGGVGHSGIGGYHGKHSFEVFSHRKSIVRRSTKFDPGFVYPPYGNKLKLARKLLK